MIPANNISNSMGCYWNSHKLLKTNTIRSFFGICFSHDHCKNKNDGNRKMDALSFTSSKQKLELIKANIPDVGKHPNGVLVKVAYAGICGTDVHIIHGRFPCKEDGPIILGHEISGVVEEIGKNVCNITPGDKVAIDPNSGCNKCNFCHRGQPHFCVVGGLTNTIGIYRNGGWSEYVLVEDNQVYKLPKCVELCQGALCEPLSCISHALDLINPMHLGQEILILGSGIIGNLLCSMLHGTGHMKVTVSEPNEVRLDITRKLNTGYDLITPNELEERKLCLDNYFFDLILDCSGSAKAIEKSIDLLNPGGKLCIFGVAAPDATMQVNPYLMFRNELTIIGAKINPFSFLNAIGYAESLGDRYLDYEKLGIKTFKLKDYLEAIDTLEKGEVAKAMFEFGMYY